LTLSEPQKGTKGTKQEPFMLPYLLIVARAPGQAFFVLFVPFCGYDDGRKVR
jgi:hypothetical protein